MEPQDGELAWCCSPQPPTQVPPPPDLVLPGKVGPGGHGDTFSLFSQLLSVWVVPHAGVLEDCPQLLGGKSRQPTWLTRALPSNATIYPRLCLYGDRGEQTFSINNQMVSA